MGENERGRIIAAEAKRALSPLGFRRKGLSRLWLSDHGFWLGVVEFQPSGFSKGTYCNVAVNWLWRLDDVISFDYGCERVGSFIDFVDVETFETAVGSMADDAGRLADLHARKFSSLNAAADVLAGERGDSALQRPPGDWANFHAGVACGLIDDRARARRMFEHLLSYGDGTSDWESGRASLARRFLATLNHRDGFRAIALDMINSRRRSEKLAPYDLR